MSKRKTHSEFIAEIRGRGLSVLGVYKTNKTPIFFRCDKCKAKWKAKPNNILANNSGCPECAKKRSALKRRGSNDWFINGDGYAVVDISTPTHYDVAMLMDEDDWIAILENPLAGRVGAVRFGGNERLYAEFVIDGKRATIHRYVMGFPRMVDHINRDGLDNRRCNLRECNGSQNNMNSVRRSVSGHKGVDLVQYDRWRARIKKDGREIHLGYFNSKEDAIKARIDAEIKLFGEFANA